VHRSSRVLNTRDDDGGKTISWQTQQPQSLLDLSTARSLLGVSFITSPIYAHLWPQTALQKRTVLCHTHARHTTALQPNLFLTGMHRLLVTNKWRPSFPRPNNCQGHLQTTELLTLKSTDNMHIKVYQLFEKFKSVHKIRHVTTPSSGTVNSWQAKAPVVKKHLFTPSFAGGRNPCFYDTRYKAIKPHKTHYGASVFLRKSRSGCGMVHGGPIIGFGFEDQDIEGIIILNWTLKK